MPSYIRPHSEGIWYLRALMKSALPLLNNAAASRAVSTFRVWGSWSDRSCHQLDHPSHRAAGFFNLVASPSSLSWPSCCPRKRLGHTSGLWLVSPLVDYPLEPTCSFAVDATPTQQGPHDPCGLVRHRHCRPVPPSTLEQPPYPLAATVRSQLHPAQRRPCPVDQQCAQVAIAPLADPSQSRLPTHGVLLGHQPSPGGELAAILEYPDMAYRRDQRHRCDRADPWDRHQTLTLRMRLGQAFELLLVIGDLLLSGDTRLNQLPKHLPAHSRERVLLGLERLHHGLMARRHPCGNHDPLFVHQSVHVIDQGCPLAHEPLTHSVQGLEIWLVDVLGWDNTHGRARHRFSDGLGITPIVLVRLDTWRDELGRHALDLVAMLTDTSGPVMRPATGFSPDAHRGQPSDTGHIRACRVRRLRQSMFPVVSAPTR
jgi:hypothetical protein